MWAATELAVYPDPVPGAGDWDTADFWAARSTVFAEVEGC
jgi:hypothetical protein